MIDRQHNRIVIECDACGAVHEGKSAAWVEVWPEARREGWKAQMVGNDWVHTCPECRNYSIAGAREHWGPGGDSDRPDCLAMVEKIAAFASQQEAA